MLVGKREDSGLMLARLMLSGVILFAGLILAERESSESLLCHGESEGEESTDGAKGIDVMALGFNPTGTEVLTGTGGDLGLTSKFC
jgi:hypothetical protein